MAERAGCEDVAVVVVNWNGRHYLQPCLSSIRAAGQIVLVDNGSTDGSVAFVRRHFPSVVLIKNTENRGFSAANNQGMRATDLPFLLFLNNDTVMGPGALTEMRQAFLRDPRIAVVGARLVKPDGTTQSSSSRNWVTLRREVRRILTLWDKEAAYREGTDYDRSHYTQAVSGAALMIRRSVLERVGGWSEEYFAYAEDVELCRKVARAGFRSWYESGATVLHFHGGSTKHQGLRRSLWGHSLSHRSVNRYIRKYEGWWAGAAHALLYPVDLGLTALRVAVRGLVRIPLRKGWLSTRS